MDFGEVDFSPRPFFYRELCDDDVVSLPQWYTDDAEANAIEREYRPRLVRSAPASPVKDLIDIKYTGSSLPVSRNPSPMDFKSKMDLSEPEADSAPEDDDVASVSLKRKHDAISESIIDDRNGIDNAETDSCAAAPAEKQTRNE